jgi:acetoin utilization protein AcuB
MFVRDRMTRQPITVRPESDPLAALAVLKAAGFRHLPVVDAQGDVVGIVDRRELEVFLSTAGSPGIVKRQHRVDQAMSSPVISVSPDCPLEEAASLMIEHRIGSLPVVENGRLVGIITKTDIFKQFVAVLGGGTKTLRLTVRVPDRPGQLSELAGRIARVNGNVSSVVAYAGDRPGRLYITLRVEGVDHGVLLAALAGHVGLEVVDAWAGEE